MTGFPFEGTWSLGAMADLPVGTAVDFSHTGGDGDTRKESKSLAATNDSGIEGSARVIGIWCHSGDSNSVGLKGAHSGARINGTGWAVEVSEWAGVDRPLFESLCNLRVGD